MAEIDSFPGIPEFWQDLSIYPFNKDGKSTKFISNIQLKRSNLKSFIDSVNAAIQYDLRETS
jgi:hypothetical protein